MERWAVHEGAFESPTPFEDPVRDASFTAELTAPSGRVEKVEGFWDGGKTYRWRFSPDETGTWKVKLRLVDRSESGLEAKGESFVCVPPRTANPLLEHGRVGVSKDGHHLVHADGRPFFWLGCTAWNGALSPDLDGWKAYLADRASKGFTAIQFVATQWRAAKGDRDGRVAYQGKEKIAIEPAFFQRLDRMVAEVNRHGLLAAPVVLWAIGDSTGRSPGSSLPEPEAILLAKHIVARYGAYHVLWFLGGDGAYGGERAEKWKRIGRAVFPDPAKSLVSMHPGGMQWVARELEGEPWFDVLGYQSGHGDDDRTLRWLTEGPPAREWKMAPQRPVVNLEPNYEGHLSYHSRTVITDFMVRRAAYWSLLASPTAGVTYGAHGIWFFSDRAEEPLEHSGTGVAPSYREAMKLPGADQMAILRWAMEYIEWWRLRPAQEILATQPGKETPRRFVAAAMSEERDLAVIYSPEDREVEIAMDRLRPKLLARWLDPRTGVSETFDDAPFSATRKFRFPKEGDWLLFLEATTAERAAAAQFKDAVAAWRLGDPSDSAGKDSALRPEGAVRFTREEDGATVAALEGGWLDAGQGAGGELNLTGEEMTLFIRLRDPGGKWDTSLFSKHGGHGKLLYNLFTLDFGAGMELGFELGTERGMFQVKTPMALIGPTDWHEVLARYDGKLLELFVDGVRMHSLPARGALRKGNTEPCIVGGESQGGKVVRPFRGMIDEAALWSRALSDGGVWALSGGLDRVKEKARLYQERRTAAESAIAERLSQDPQRPRCHFLPPAHWMNDPNGLYHWKGEYHLFYQHNPHGAFWGTMHWGHARSRDLVRWEHLPVALAPTPGGPDWDGCFSGCLVDDGGVPTIVYTAVTPEVQAVATSRDGLLTWEKHPRNPVIAAPPPGLKVTGFRDPWVWKEADGWYMVIGSGLRGTGGAALLYRSPDLVAWEYLHPLIVGDRKFGEMWECPNFFPLGGKHVLLVSTLGTTLYFVGSYRDHKFTPEVEGDTDFGRSFYAAQCIEDDRGRRILFGWLREGRGDRAQRAAGWSGAMSLPRVLSLLPDGKLGMEPAPEVTSLRRRPIGSIEAGSIRGVEGELIEARVEIEPGSGSPAGLRVRYAGDAASAGEIDIAHDNEKGRLVLKRGNHTREGPFRLSAGEALTLHLFIDGSIVEVFANGRACLTDRVYPARAGFRVESLPGGTGKLRSLEAFELKPMSSTGETP